MYSITQHLTVFMVSCHENKVWFWVLFNIPPLPEALERDRNIWHHIHQCARKLVLVNPGQVSPLGNTTILMGTGTDTFYTLQYAPKVLSGVYVTV